jgi:hypothetical protein
MIRTTVRCLAVVKIPNGTSKPEFIAVGDDNGC